MASILSLVDPKKATVVCGDFNICYTEHKNHSLIQSMLASGFDQKVTRATHIQGGLIDHVYFCAGETLNDVEVQMYSPYYTALDHDAILVTVTKKG